MTFAKGQQQAFDLTEKEMKGLWTQTKNAYADSYKNIDAILAINNSKFKSLSKEQQAKGIYNYMIQRDRLTKLQKQIQTEYVTAARKAGASIAKSSELAISNTFYREQYTLTWFSPSANVNLGFATLDPRLIEASVFGTEAQWKAIQADALAKYGDMKQYFPQAGSLTERLLKNRNAELAKLKETITSGLIQGKSYTKLTADVKDVFNTSLNNASRIVRTEGTRNLNNGVLASMNDASSQGLEQLKEWVATLDATTRGSHQSADGQRVDIDGLFSVNGATGEAPGQLSSAGENINCRCTMISIVEGLEPQIRRGRNPVTGENSVFDYTDFNTWASNNGMKQDKNGIWKV